MVIWEHEGNVENTSRILVTNKIIMKKFEPNMVIWDQWEQISYFPILKGWGK